MSSLIHFIIHNFALSAKVFLCVPVCPYCLILLSKFLRSDNAGWAATGRGRKRKAADTEHVSNVRNKRIRMSSQLTQTIKA